MRGGVEGAADGQRVGVGRRAGPRGHLQLGGLHGRVGVGGGGGGGGRCGLLRLVLLHHLQIEAVDLRGWLNQYSSIGRSRAYFRVGLKSVH